MRASLGLLLMMIFTACSTAPIGRTLDQVQPGMDKSAVLDTAGNPKRTYRERGEDHWIYVFYEGDREFSREVIFEGGKVERVTRPRAKANWEKELENSKPSGDAGFKPVDGPP